MGCSKSKVVIPPQQDHQIHSEKTKLDIIPEEVNDESVVKENIFFGYTIPFSDIQIQGIIGKGTFGQVYQATIQGYSVAVKELFLPESQTEQDEVLHDFEKEVKIISMLRHPNIIQFYGCVFENPHFCLVTELCKGSVFGLLLMVGMKKVNITWRICMDIAIAVAKAILYLHTFTPQILHRDLKSENLLLTDQFICKLTDFGLSRILNHSNATLQMTLCGTPSWVAPEIFRGEAYSSAVDVYAFGIVLWELFCFQKPYENKDPVNLPYLVALEHLRPPILPHLPESLVHLMTDCWSPNIITRPHFDVIVNKLNYMYASFQLDDVIDTNSKFN